MSRSHHKHLDPRQRTAIRARIFRHLDGFAVAPIAVTLGQNGVLQDLLDNVKADVGELAASRKANEGYLNVALRILASQGWLTQTCSGTNIIYALTPKGEVACAQASIYGPYVDFLPLAKQLGQFLDEGFPAESHRRFSLMAEQLANDKGSEIRRDSLSHRIIFERTLHEEGLLLGPALVALGMKGVFDDLDLRTVKKQGASAELTIPGHIAKREQWEPLLELFRARGWLEAGNLRPTPAGQYLFRRSAAYGVTISYLDTFLAVPDLIFGDASHFWNRPEGSEELHVDRTMNVWGSGGAHTAYFRKIDEIVIDLFNQPIDQQPLGFADMGSGNGAFLEHLFDVIWTRTLRGKLLHEHPLVIVGSDFNEAALRATRERLDKADIWAEVTFGDISDPDGLAQALREKRGVELGDLLNVRSFLDHNRIYEAPEAARNPDQFSTTGAFSFRGRRLANADVERNLVEHLARWKPYIGRFGLLVIELHTLPPAVAAAHLGEVPVTAYDATHGFSDQYTVELPVFMDAAQRAGLAPDPVHRAVFPSEQLATVSINLLREARR